MNANLFLAYLRIRKFLPAIAILSILIITINQFFNYHNVLAETEPWIVQSVVSGNSLTVVRDDEMKKIKLCGISGGDETYLRSLINRGNGSVVVNPISKTDNVTVAEVFVPLLPDMEQEIHLNTEMIMGGVATVDNPDICPSAEYLEIAAAIKNQ